MGKYVSDLAVMPMGLSDRVAWWLIVRCLLNSVGEILFDRVEWSRIYPLGRVGASEMSPAASAFALVHGRRVREAVYACRWTSRAPEPTRSAAVDIVNVDWCGGA